MENGTQYPIMLLNKNTSIVLNFRSFKLALYSKVTHFNAKNRRFLAKMGRSIQGGIVFKSGVL